MSISNPEVKKLYGLSAGRCSICEINLFDNHVHIGEMAHIIAKNNGGARGDVQSSTNINSYENLILLCANHHTEVDQNSNHYTVDHLHVIKSKHECKVASHFEGTPKERENDIGFLKYFMYCVPFTQLRVIVDRLPASVNLCLCEVGDTFDAALIYNPHLYPLNDQRLQNCFQLFIDGYRKIWGIVSGYTEVNGRQQANFSQADERGYLYMENRYLPYKEVQRLRKLIEERLMEFMGAYSELMDFIRKNYKEVDLNSYKPPRFD